MARRVNLQGLLVILKRIFMPPQGQDASRILLELGVAIVGLARLRAGVVLVARGEFSIAIAGMGVALEPRLGPLVAAYVLFLAILGPVLARFVR